MKLIFITAIFVVAIQANPQPDISLDFSAGAGFGNGFNGFAGFRLGSSGTGGSGSGSGGSGSVSDTDDGQQIAQTSNPFQGFFRNIGSNIRFDIFGNNAQQGIEAASDFSIALTEAAESVANDASSIARAATASLDLIFEYGIESFLLALNQLRTVVNFVIEQSQNSLQQFGWKSIQLRLNKVSQAAQELQSVTAQIRKLWSSEIEDNASETVDQWHDWAAEIYLKTNLNSNDYEHKQKIIKETLNDYVSTYTSYLNECVDSVKQKLLQFEKKVQNAAGSYKNLMGSLFVQMEICLPSSSVTCQRSATISMRKFSETPRLLKRLTAEGKGLNATYSEIDCVKETLNEAENEKAEVESQIEEIVKSVKNESENEKIN